MADSGAAAALQGRVMDASSDQIIISLGSGTGVAKGMTLGVYSAKSIVNPDTRKTIVTYRQTGVIVVTQVDKDYSVGKKIKGTVVNAQTVRSEQ